MNSQIFDLNWSDFLHGLIVAVFSAAISALYTALVNGQEVDYKTILQGAVIGGLGYLLKKLGDDENGKFVGKV